VVSLLVVGLIALPLLGSALVVVMRRETRSSAVHGATLTATGLTGLCALALLPYAGDSVAIAIEWLPGTGAMRLSIGATGLYAALVTTWSLFLVLLGTTSSSSERPRLSGVVMLVALGATNVAFLAGHFLARYVALEVVALCIAVALPVEMRGPRGIRLGWGTYLLLRLGDAGLLTGILILMDASGTLSIGPALEHALSSIEGVGGALTATRLGLVVAGFVLAVWIKVGGWPFHVWSKYGRRLTLASHAWLYAAVMPNLGMYLLYRTTPLLALTGPLQTAALWLGAGGAALAALVALTQADLRTALAHLGAVLGGLVLFVAASGVKSAVWMCLLAMTPLRLLLFLTAAVAESPDSLTRRRVAASLFALGGLALTALGLLTVYWARQAGAPLDALAAWRLSGSRFGAAKGSETHWTLWVTAGLLGAGTLAGVLTFGPLVRHLSTVSSMVVPDVPTLPDLLRFGTTAPALLVVVVVAMAVWRLRWRSRSTTLASAQSSEEAYDLAEGLARAAQVLHAVIEVGIAKQIVALAVRAVVDGARVAHRVVERGGLEGLLGRCARTVVNGAGVAHRVVEHGGLEGLLGRCARVVGDGAAATQRVVEREGLEGQLRGSVRSLLVASKGLQRRHTGRLRRNLLWMAISLLLAILLVLLYGG